MIRVYELNRGLFWFDVPQEDRIVGSTLRKNGITYGVSIGGVIIDGATKYVRSYTARISRVAKRQEVLQMIASRADEAGVQVVTTRIKGDG